VAANYLDINHRDGVYSGLAETRPDISIANFGIAASITNCSAGSNQTLRFGGKRSNYRQAFEEMPSIWAFARRAGRRTVYLDGQRQGGELQNRMTPAEAAEIDDFIQVGDTPVSERDHELARLLGERLRNGISELILVNKVGAHFPVADKFPLSAAKFQPLPRRSGLEITDASALTDANKSEHGWRLYRNAYRNALAWSTGGFFDRLLPQVANSEAVIVYTSDHGQDLHERGGAGGSTHCMPDPRAEEGAVPLVVIADSRIKIDWQEHVASNFDSTSHFRIFPTLLVLLGYPANETRGFYGQPLMSRERDPLTFTPNYRASLGRDPVWRRVVRSELAEPPTADYAPIAHAR
jgi:lipid A ethanolaminephosphotransferase